MAGYITFTPKGLEEVKKEREQLLAARPQAVENLRTAREMGDLSENGAYHAARARLSQIDRRIRHLNYLIRFANVEEGKTEGFVGINSTVIVSIGDTTVEYQIVGSFESDPSKQKISFQSPIGKALMGKRAGDTVSITVPNGNTVRYKVISVK